MNDWYLYKKIINIVTFGNGAIFKFKFCSCRIGNLSQTFKGIDLFHLFKPLFRTQSWTSISITILLGLYPDFVLLPSILYFSMQDPSCVKVRFYLRILIFKMNYTAKNSLSLFYIVLNRFGYVMNLLTSSIKYPQN